MTNLKIILLGLLFLITFIHAGAISACTNLIAGTSYSLSQDINFAFNAACMNFTSSTITFTCSGFHIIGNGGANQIGLNVSGGGALANNKIGNCGTQADPGIKNVGIGILVNGSGTLNIGTATTGGPVGINNTRIGILIYNTATGTCGKECAVNISNTNISNSITGINISSTGVDMAGYNMTLRNINIVNSTTYGIRANFAASNRFDNITINNCGTGNCLMVQTDGSILNNFTNFVIQNSGGSGTSIDVKNLAGLNNFTHFSIQCNTAAPCIVVGDGGSPASNAFLDFNLTTAQTGLLINGGAQLNNFSAFIIDTPTLAGVSIAGTATGNTLYNVSIATPNQTFINSTTSGSNILNGTLLAYNFTPNNGWFNISLTTVGTNDVWTQNSNLNITPTWIGINLTAIPDLNKSGTMGLMQGTNCVNETVMFADGYYTSIPAIIGNGTVYGIATCNSGSNSFAVSPIPEIGSYTLKFTPTLNLTFSGPTLVGVLYNNVNITNFGNVTNMFLFLDLYPTGLTDIIFNSYQHYQFYNNQSGNYVDTLQIITRNGTAGIATKNTGIGVVQNASVKIYTNVSNTWVKYDQEFTGVNGFMYPPIMAPGNPIKITADKDGFSQAIVLDDTANVLVNEYDIRMDNGQFVFSNGLLVVPLYAGASYPGNKTDQAYYVSTFNAIPITVDIFLNGTNISETNYSTSNSFIIPITGSNISNNYTIYIWDNQPGNNNLLYFDWKPIVQMTTIGKQIASWTDRTVFTALLIILILLSSAAEFYYMIGMETFLGLGLLLSLLSIYFIPVTICGIIYFILGKATKPLYSEGG